MYQQENTVEAQPSSSQERTLVPNLNEMAKASERLVVRSGYLVERLFNTPENNLFNYVKFNLVNRHINRIGIETPRVMDIGCGLQVAKRFLTALNQNITYYGIDYEPTFQPDAVVDLNRKGALDGPMSWTPDVVMLLDVLEHLHEKEEDLERVVKHIAQAMPHNARVIITVPQLYRLDRFKFSHLHYPEHKIRLTQTEWRDVIEKHFKVTHTQGVGYLSVIPYLPMALRNYQPDNALGRLFNHLRSRTFEKRWLKPLDLFLSNTLGRLRPFKYLANDILFVAVPREPGNRATS